MDNNTSLPPTRKLATCNVVTQDVVDYIESEKLCKPSTYTSELQQPLLQDGVSPPHRLPSQSAIKKCIRKDCFMTKKKLTEVPRESLSDININYKDNFLDQIAQLDCTTLHFFDESGVKITSGNRVYGNSYIGEPAIEFQRYASNANYTLDLLHSIQGVDYYNILRGASNGMEMLNFFDEALAVERAGGSPILELGDCIIMHNCGFHLGHQVEPLLRDILQEHSINLLFQRSYLPHLNTCEFCFNQVKCYLKQNTLLTLNETEIAIGKAVSKIDASNSVAYFRNCGYL